MEEWNFDAPPESSLGDREVLLEGNHLQGKRIALLITGSIAALKAPLIARSLRRQGADVVAFASSEALRYTTIDALEWSTTNPVITKLTAAAEHLSDENPFAVYLVAPATYNTINKIACGIADGVVTSSIASAIGRMERGKTTVMIAPTMHGSLHNSILTASLQKLHKIGVRIIPPLVAYGKNNLPSEAEIVTAVCRGVSSSPLKNSSILVTGGATPVPIDNVRRLTNRFTGTLGGKIAEELYYRGAKVKLIRGQGSYSPPNYLPQQTIDSYEEYKTTVIEELTQHQYQCAIFSAAVADYQSAQVFPGKIPSGGALQSINLIPTAKVIAEVRARFPQLYMVTFKYQENIDHDQLMAIANQRLQQGYQMVVANRGEEKGAQGEQIAYLVTSEQPPIKSIGKQGIAIAIADFLAQSSVIKQ
ncbi:phosphopantothenoylcysteine decarboxylase/phosphopantothenate--cysteine ligase [Xenococcus sp. PCC 7305]|uniref:bifunctional phosphopantothenoylcysteine decarboxylase/phosphopantothenate--cysteine ligase CoaBC n=1 Tax=Xenococcus sp. PCC 7305 TaxID=102125 RepID=UPI0002AC7458|nr:bifunctional phosphopantothenoylcysteine decarboxylase/phosphopantothenate--cysteine ligase CoaBC [Xenococcus sp. PCC 7305]ELS02438.1 phosphopantothenoylcysteine decarboxylase/phosphopantothenate--cysteine ligase [Xenococcus sp. PCC 7305]